MVRAGYGVEALDPLRDALVGFGGSRSWVAVRHVVSGMAALGVKTGCFEEEDDDRWNGQELPELLVSADS